MTLGLRKNDEIYKKLQYLHLYAFKTKSLFLKRKIGQKFETKGQDTPMNALLEGTFGTRRKHSQSTC